MSRMTTTIKALTKKPKQKKKREITDKEDKRKSREDTFLQKISAVTHTDI